MAGARGGDLLEVAMVTPFICICLHLLIACFAVNWHLPSILNIAYQQVHKSRKMSYMYMHYSSSFECINSHINSQTFNAENTKTLTYKLTHSGQVLKYQHLKSGDEKNCKKIELCSFPLKFGDTKIQIYTHIHG